jgi:hypothetical protein
MGYFKKIIGFKFHASRFMQYHVPQFIEIEDKIFGPLTTKQFFYVLAAASVLFVMFLFLKLWAVVLVGGPIAGFFVALAFLKINGVPFLSVVSNALTFVSSQKLFLWKKRQLKTAGKKKVEEMPENSLEGTKLTQNKLQDLAWSLDIQKNVRNKT